jgi:hypothetical protein
MENLDFLATEVERHTIAIRLVRQLRVPLFRRLVLQGAPDASAMKRTVLTTCMLASGDKSALSRTDDLESGYTSWGVIGAFGLPGGDFLQAHYNPRDSVEIV